MDLTEYVDTLRLDLLRAAKAMGGDAENAAERLGFALDSAARLALLDALSHAAAEITNELEGTSVEVRLQGREPQFVVVGQGRSVDIEPTREIPTSDTTAIPVDAEGEETARITLRIPDALKARAEELASARGQSLNTWIVGAVRAATQPGASWATAFGPGAPGRNRASTKRVQGWVR